MAWNRSICLRAGIAVLMLAVVFSTANAPKIGTALAIAGVTGWDWVQSSIYCKPKDPAIYLGGVLMAGCPNAAHR